MKKSRAVVLTIAFILTLTITFTPTASLVSGNATNLPKVCSCSAPDGSCSVSVTCTGQCTKFCGNNDNCSASCSGFYSYFGNEVTFEMRNGNYSKLVAELVRVGGKDLEFSPTKPDMVFNVGFQGTTLWDALKVLSDQGTVHVAGQDFKKIKRLRRLLLAGERFSFGVNNTPVNTFVNDLAGLTGLKLNIIAGSPRATVNVELQDATLSDILHAVSEQTGTKIIEEGADTGGR
jgi:hypothetical protein